jgi:hypothetical protein
MDPPASQSFNPPPARRVSGRSLGQNAIVNFGQGRLPVGVIQPVLFALWCVWGYFGCGLLPVWRRGWRGATAVVAAVLASFALLFNAALLLQVCGWRLSRSSWLLASIVLAVGAACVPGRPPAVAGSPTAVAGRRRRTWLWLAVAFAALAIGYRLMVQPLTGYDTAFRWDFLARQVVANHSFGFYPPATDADFLQYSWPESIPPLVSLLYAWAYFGAGTTAPWVTAIIGLLVAGLVFVLVDKLATRAGGTAAGALACGLLATSALHTWAVSMGQETGILTLGVLGLVWAIGRGSDEDPDWCLAALAGGVTALARDYGGTALVAGAVALAGMRRPWREVAGYAAVGLAVILPWYVRTWVLAGNPFYNHDLLGLFPFNPIQGELMSLYPRYLGWMGHLSARLQDLLAQLWPLGPLLLLAGTAGMTRLGPRLAGMRLLAGIWIGLWAWSVGYTMGGFQYSLRVLSPVLALLAVAGGVWLARRGEAFHRSAWYAGLMLLAAEASLRAVLMLHAPTEYPIRLWSAIGASFSASRGGANESRAAGLIGPHRVLVDNAYEHALLTQRGVRAVPLWSPGVRFLFASDVDMADVVRRLRQEDLRFLILTSAPDLKLLLGRYRFFRELRPWVQPVMAGDDWMLFALEQKSIQPRAMITPEDAPSLRP